MKKLGRREYLQMFCETLVDSYGGTLSEWDTDLTMAKDLMRKLRQYLIFSESDMTDKEWISWRREFLASKWNRSESELDELGVKIKVPSKRRSRR